MSKSQALIATRLKMSQSAVSRALRNDEALPLETRQKVQSLARELNYTPRRYKRKKDIIPPVPKNQMILVLAHDKITQRSDIFIEMIQGISQAAVENSVPILVKSFSTIEGVRTIINENNGNIGGIINVFSPPADVMEYLCKKYKCVSINHYYPHLPVKVIDSAQSRGIYSLYERLYNLGHRKIGFISIENSSALAFPRFAGYQAALKNYDTKIDTSAIFNVLDIDTPFDEMIDKIIDLHNNENYTAFIATSGSFAKLVYKELTARGINVPDQISLVGYDEVTQPISGGTMLTGVEAPYEAMAKHALNFLCSKDNDLPLDCVTSFMPIFMNGNTTAPPCK